MSLVQYNDTYVKFPMLSVKPNYTTLYYEYDMLNTNSYTEKTFSSLPEDNQHKGVLSDKAKSRIRTAVNWLVEIARDKKVYDQKKQKWFRFRISFITLTLPSIQMHSDMELKHLALNQFLTELRKKFGRIRNVEGVDKKVLNYLWKAEKQKNGNIHFHITTDVYIPHAEIRALWNRILDKLGYIQSYRNNMQTFHSNGFQIRKDLLKRFDVKSRKYIDHWTHAKQKQAYDYGIKTNWSNPNTTDIHSVKNIRKLPAYISEYFTKNELTEAEQEDYAFLQDSINKLRNQRDEYAQTITELLEHNMAPTMELHRDMQEILDKINSLKEEIKSKYGNKVIEGRIWGLSQSLSNIKLKIDIINSDINYESEVENLLELLKDKIIEHEYYFIIPATIRQIRSTGCDNIAHTFSNFIAFHRNESLELPFKTLKQVPT